LAIVVLGREEEPKVRSGQGHDVSEREAPVKDEVAGRL